MKELASILSICSLQPESTLALATLVKVSGSTYRHLGARMLLLRNGESIGSVSGGCLERDVVNRHVGEVRPFVLRPALAAID